MKKVVTTASAVTKAEEIKRNVAGFGFGSPALTNGLECPPISPPGEINKKVEIPSERPRDLSQYE